MTLVEIVPLLTLIVINAGLVALPLYLILRKAGKPRVLALIALFPFGEE